MNKKYQDTLELINKQISVDDLTISSLEEVLNQNIKDLKMYENELPQLKQQIIDLDIIKNSMRCSN